MSVALVGVPEGVAWQTTPRWTLEVANTADEGDEFRIYWNSHAIDVKQSLGSPPEIVATSSMLQLPFLVEQHHYFIPLVSQQLTKKSARLQQPSLNLPVQR